MFHSLSLQVALFFFSQQNIEFSQSGQVPVSFFAFGAGVAGAGELAGPEKPSRKKRASSLGGALLFVSLFGGAGAGQ